MHKRLSLRFRLNLMIVLTMLLIIGLGTLFAIHDARRSVAEEIDSTVNLALQLIEASLSESRSAAASSPDWLAQFGRLDKTRHLRIQVRETARDEPDRTEFAPAGRHGAEPAGQSGHSPADLPAQPNPAEAAAPDWFAWSVAPDPILVEKRVKGGDNREIAIFIEADPADEIAEAWNEARGFLALMAVLAVAVYLLVHVTVGRAFRTVGLILEGLEDIEKGEYGKRLSAFELPEFARISRAFNHMASALEKARDDNRALTQQTLAIQEEERRYLAQEIHDELGQSLSAIKVMAAALRKRGDGARDNQAVDHIMAICDRLFGVVRAMMRRLRPLILDELGLAASVEDLVDNWRNRNPGIRLEFRCDEGVERRAEAAKIHVYRIVQECLTNVVKHADAGKVVIELGLADPAECRDAWILLKIGDDGRGFDPGQPRRGFGLLGIRERVASLGGRFTLTSAPGAGVSLEILIPGGETSPCIPKSP
jgi:two-component system sensor histidine kinase UhpB